MPRDLSTRLAFFYCASALSGAFSGLLAAGIAQMDGVGGYEGWRWIFILEGLATVVLGVACFFLLIDSPRLSSRWLEPDEIRFLELQLFIKEGGELKKENEAERKKRLWKDLFAVVKNWRVYPLSYILLCQAAVGYGMHVVSADNAVLVEMSYADCCQGTSSPFLALPRRWDIPTQKPS